MQQRFLVKITLRVSVLQARDLIAKDRNGSSDPFVVVSLAKSQTQKTRVVPRDLNPEWNQTLDFEIDAGVNVPKNIQFDVWDKDIVGKEFLGRLVVPLIDIKPSEDCTYAIDDDANIAIWYPLSPRTTRRDKVSGELRVRLAWKTGNTVEPGGEKHIIHEHPFWSILHEVHGKDPQVSAGFLPTNESTAPMTEQDDLFDQLTVRSFTRDLAGGVGGSAAGVMLTDHMVSQSATCDGENGDRPSTPVVLPPDVNPNRMPPVGQESLGLVMIELVSAKQLPKRRSAIPGRFDMDPFVTVSFAKKTFKTRFIPHTLNPTWNESVYFNIKHSDMGYSVKFSIYDHDTVSHNDYIGDFEIKVEQLLEKFLSGELKGIDGDIMEREVTLNLEQKKPNDKVAFLKFRVNFKPYVALRRKFWTQVCAQFDVDGNMKFNRIELSAMLESIGSTSSEAIIAQIFESHGQGVDGSFAKEDLITILEETINDSNGLVEIRACPTCQRPLSRGTILPSDLDAITHIALCFTDDRTDNVESYLIGGYATEAFAQRKWISRLASYVSFGKYKMGNNNGNILVQDRATGLLIEEKIPVYVRLGIRLLYQSAASRGAIESKMIKRMLQSMTVKQGRKFETPSSVRQILQFCKFHRINVDEIFLPDLKEGQQVTLKDLPSYFKNFNQFFYRKLKPGSRPIAAPENPRVLVSPADSRMNAFASVASAQELWIKGDAFSVKTLLDDAKMASYYENGYLAVFRLAPQDYHRFHHAVDGVVGPSKHIEGTYYTVNPMAIRDSFLSVYTENVRTITYINSDHFGQVAYVAIGAMMVGSIILTDSEGQRVKRGDEHGYFAFGGSTVILIFPPKIGDEGMKIVWDEDLVANSNSTLETVVKMGTRIGTVE